MRKFFRIFTVIIIFNIIVAGIFGAEKDELFIVNLNDVHGRLEESKTEIGYSRVKTYIEDLKKKSPEPNSVLVIDAGDYLHGTTLATLDRGASIVEVMNWLEVDVTTLGNHDFNYGQARIKELEKLAHFKIVATNVLDSKGKNFTLPYVIKEYKNKKIGIFGLSTPETTYKTNPLNVKGLKFEDSIKVAKATVAELKSQNVDYIIAITHLGIDESTLPELRSTAVANAVPEINLIIDGHSHSFIEKKMVVNGVTIIQTGSNLRAFGVSKINLDKTSKNYASIDYKLITRQEAEKISPHKSLAGLIANINADQNKITEKVIGKTSVKLDGVRDNVRSKETNLADLITDSMIWKTNADMSITNGGGIRDSIGVGNITVGKVITVLPFGNYVVTKEITGKEIKEMLEFGFSQTPTPAGSQAQVGGITVIVSLSKPVGERIIDIKFNNGKAFDENTKYIVATNDFMAVGGDGYSAFKDKKEIGNFSGMDEILIEYIRVKGISKKLPDGRIIIATK
ncbi:MAG: bifunctional metallophosphatase/5'-nucleotidase [Fusobacteriaceae bacterium]